MARSRDIAGPYELHPDIHLLTSKDAPEAPLQRAGHGQIVQTTDGAVYHTHLCSRPLPRTRRSPLGRETAIQKCVWGEDGWLRLEGGGVVPSLEVPAPSNAGRVASRPMRLEHRFDGSALPLEFQWPRTPYPQRLFSLDAAPGRLRLFGRESIGSWFEQALVARRQEDFAFLAETEIHFDPETDQQAAGLTHYYNRHKFHLAAITRDRTGNRVLMLMSCLGDWPDGRLSFAPETPKPVSDSPIALAAEVRHAELQFHYRDRSAWQPLGPVLDASLISDEAGRGEHGSFTGAFVGMAAFDTSGAGRPADFSHFVYERLEG